MRRYIAFFMVVVCIFSVIGCQKSGESAVGNGGKCLVCNDEGVIKCATCKGTGVYGEKKVECPSCHGEGEVRCQICTDNTQENDNNSNSNSDSNSDSNSNSNQVINPGINDNFNNNIGGNYPVSCARCQNKGTITCTGCGGAGKLPNTQYAPDFGNGGGMYESYTTCRTCGGNKIIDCPYC